MKKNEKRRDHADLDRFDRKQKRVSGSKKQGSSKHRLSIYDDFEDEELDDVFGAGRQVSERENALFGEAGTGLSQGQTGDSRGGHHRQSLKY